MRDKTPPVITNVTPAQGATVGLGTTRLDVKANVTDTIGVYQVNFYIDPAGQTYPAPNKSNKAFSGYSDFWPRITEFGGTMITDGITAGTHTLRVDAYDRALNLSRKEITFTVA